MYISAGDAQTIKTCQLKSNRSCINSELQILPGMCYRLANEQEKKNLRRLSAPKTYLKCRGGMVSLSPTEGWER